MTYWPFKQVCQICSNTGYVPTSMTSVQSECQCQAIKRNQAYKDHLYHEVIGKYRAMLDKEHFDNKEKQ